MTKKRQSIFLEKDFSDILIKGRAAKGNLLTKRPIRRIGLKSHGHSTLGAERFGSIQMSTASIMMRTVDTSANLMTTRASW